MQHMHDGDEIIVFVDGLTEAIKGISDAPTVEKAWRITTCRSRLTSRPKMKLRVYF